MAIADEVKNQAGRTVGFVVDADDSLEVRWQSVKDRLLSAEILVDGESPQKLDDLQAYPSDGLIGISQKYKTRVGVWIMPGGGQPGALENFLESLIPCIDTNEFPPLYQYAQEATSAAQASHRADFRKVDLLKANQACWLAWQKNPGRPYGTAIRAGYFAASSPVADQFVSWFKTLFQIST